MTHEQHPAAPSEAHMKAVLQQYIDGFTSRDADALAALFADDATIEDPVGSDPVRGKDAIAGMYRRGVTMVTSINLSAPIRGSHANAAAMAFDFEMEVEGRRLRTSVIDVMEFDAAGRIVRMRAYWGPSDSTTIA